ncbi:MAG: hypothetical protein J6A01_08985 [Proteobacteria bacterium]|nr:hypothetical protein [Pseudomonadota bacterium]
MTAQENQNIWSLALTRHGIGTCIHSAEGMSYRQSYFWPVADIPGIHAILIDKARALLAQALTELCQNAQTLPMAIALCSEDETTAVLLDASQKPVTPVYYELPHPMPRSEIPDKYASSPNLARMYRDSVLRRLQQTNPALGLHEPLGLYSLGALVALWLSGHGVSSCMPMGVPPQFPSFDEDSRDNCMDAIGVKPSLCMKRARCGHVFAKISPWLAQNLGLDENPELKKIAGIPIFDMGDCCGACAYASVANPLSWQATLGFDLSASWTASVSALAQYEIQIIDKSKNPEQKQEDTPKSLEDLTSNDWTRILSEHLPLDIHPGPGSSLAAYGCHCPSAYSDVFKCLFAHLADDGEGHLDFEDVLCKSPLGSHGLHCIYSQMGWLIVGMTAAHTKEDFYRALFEGMCYQLRQWREKIPTSQIGPIRLVFEFPWPAECAQWAADILESPVYLLNTPREILAAQGSAIVLLRSLDIPTKPSIQATIFEPQERSAYYRKHYQVHCALMNE